MLFTEASTLGIMPTARHRSAPGQCFHYSSLTTNAVQRSLRQSFATTEEYLTFPETALFGCVFCLCLLAVALCVWFVHVCMCTFAYVYVCQCLCL
jgi:hypothetical protein